MPSNASIAFIGLLAGVVVGGAGGYYFGHAGTGSTPMASAPAEPFHGKDDPVVAKVNGSPVYKSDADMLIASLSDQIRQMPEAELRPRVIERLVDIKLAAQKAQADRLDIDPTVRAAIATNSQQIMADAYLDKTAKMSVSDATVKAKYDELVKQVPPIPEVHARHILVKTEAEAKAVIAQLDKGGDFEKLAKEKSTEPGANESGGDLGYFTKEKMVPEFGDAAFAMEKNTYSKTPVKSNFGYHVIQLLDKRDQPPPPFDQVKAQLTNVVMQDQQTKMLADLRKGAKVELFNYDGTPMTAVPAAPAMPPAGAPPVPPAAAPAPAAPPAKK